METAECAEQAGPDVLFQRLTVDPDLVHFCLSLPTHNGSLLSKQESKAVIVQQG